MHRRSPPFTRDARLAGASSPAFPTRPSAHGGNSSLPKRGLGAPVRAEPVPLGLAAQLRNCRVRDRRPRRISKASPPSALGTWAKREERHCRKHLESSRLLSHQTEASVFCGEELSLWSCGLKDYTASPCCRGHTHWFCGGKKVFSTMTQPCIQLVSKVS